MEMEAKPGNDLWLPADFFYGDYLIDGHNNHCQFTNDNPIVTEQKTTDCDEDYMTLLAVGMANSFLHDDDKGLPDFSPDNAKARIWTESSPELAIRNREVLDNGNRNLINNTSLNFLPVAQLDHQNFRSNENHRQKLYEHELQQLSALKNAENPILHHRRLQAAHLYRIRQEQLKKEQLAAVYAQQRNGRPLGLSIESWPPLAKSGSVSQPRQSQPAMVPNKESAGTGVFLPRPVATKEPRKKPVGCLPVVVPARVVQALNLNLDELGSLQRIPGGYIFDHDALVGRSNGALAHRRSNSNRP